MFLDLQHKKKRITTIFLLRLVYIVCSSAVRRISKRSKCDIVKTVQPSYSPIKYFELKENEFETIKALVRSYEDITSSSPDKSNLDKISDHYKYYLTEWIPPLNSNDPIEQITGFSISAHNFQFFFHSYKKYEMDCFFEDLNLYSSSYKPENSLSDFIILSEILKKNSKYRSEALNMYFETSLIQVLDFVSAKTKCFTNIKELPLASNLILCLSKDIFKRLTCLVTLRLISLSDMAEISAIKELTSLRTLIVKHMNLNSDQANVISNLQNVDHLSITGCISIETIKFGKMGNLTCIRIAVCSLNNIILDNIISSKKVSSLHLKICTTSLIDLALWDRLYSMNLKKLTIKESKEAYLQLIRFIREKRDKKTPSNSVCCLYRMVELRIENANISNEELKLILANIHELNLLSLDKCSLITIDKNLCVSKKDKLTKITELNFTKTGITTINWLEYFPSLKVLKVSETNLTSLSQEKYDCKFENLEELHLDSCNLNLERFLKIIELFPALKILCADNNPVGLIVRLIFVKLVLIIQQVAKEKTIATILINL